MDDETAWSIWRHASRTLPHMNMAQVLQDLELPGVEPVQLVLTPDSGGRHRLPWPSESTDRRSSYRSTSAAPLRRYLMDRTAPQLYNLSPQFAQFDAESAVPPVG